MGGGSARSMHDHKRMGLMSDIHFQTTVTMNVKTQDAVGVPRCSRMFSTAGRVFLRGMTDTAASPLWLPTDWGLPHCPSDPWLGFGGRGGGAQEDSELEGVKAL